MTALKKSRSRYHWVRNTAWYYGDILVAYLSKDEYGWDVVLDQGRPKGNAVLTGFRTLTEAKKYVEEEIRYSDKRWI